MKQRYYYHEHLRDYAEVKARGMKFRGELYGNSDFDAFSSKAFLEAILPHLAVRPGARVLELGCGTGPGSCYLVGKGFQVDGIDLIPDAIERAKEVASDLGLDIRYEVMDVCDLPVEGVPYDLIVDSYCTQGIVMDEDRDRMFRAVKARLAARGYFLLSCCVFEPARENPDVTVEDSATGKVYTRFDAHDLFDREAEICYNLFEPDPARPDVGPEDYDGTICVKGRWYIHRRRYRTPENLRAELEYHGFEVLHQGGEVMENAVCIHRGAGVALRPTRE